MSIRYILQILHYYKYFAIFPIAVVEGPIISIITGFLASRGIISFLGGFIAVWLGDFISDAIFQAAFMAALLLDLHHSRDSLPVARLAPGSVPHGRAVFCGVRVGRLQPVQHELHL